MEKISVTLVLQHSDINRIIKGPLEFTLNEGDSVIDVFKLADEEILRRAGKFPVGGYKSLLHMVYHPFENRFYSRSPSKAIPDLAPS